MDAYKFAAKHKLRFSYKGCLNVEDLFSLSVEELDKLYNVYMTEYNKTNFSLIRESQEDKKLEAAIDIIKDIVSDKLAEVEERKADAVKAVQKQKILEALANKQTADLGAKSEEELQQMLKDL